MRLTRRELAVSIAIVGIAGILVALAAAFGAREKRTTFTRPVSVTSVEVESEAGKVEVVATESRQVTVRQTTRYLFGAPTVRESVIDGVLRLRAECPRFAAVACEVRYRLELPATVALRVRTERGSVSVKEITGPVDVATQAGGITLTRLTGAVTARTSAGGIAGVDLEPPSLDASTSAGRIRISLARPVARVDLRTRAGGIDLALPPDRYRVEAETGAGQADVTVTLDATSPYAVRARTDAGGIRIHPR